MRKTVVYLMVTLLVLSFSLTLTPKAQSQTTATSQTQNVKILDYSYYIDNMGDLDVVGEAQNIGNTTLNQIYLTGFIYDPTGVQLSPSYCEVWQSYLAPQQKAPFYLPFQAPQDTGYWQLSDIGNVTINVSQANATDSYQYTDLQVISAQASVGTTGNYSGAYVVNGVIKNTGTQTAYNLTMAATFYNSTGNVIGVGTTYDQSDPWIVSSLAPSATVNFQVATWDLNQSQVPSWEKSYSYSLIPQATGPTLQGTPTDNTYFSSNYSPLKNTPPTTTAPTQVDSSVSAKKSASAISIYPIAVAAVIIAVVLVAGLFVSKRVKSHPPQTAKEKIKARKREHD